MIVGGGLHKFEVGDILLYNGKYETITSIDTNRHSYVLTDEMINLPFSTGNNLPAYRFDPNINDCIISQAGGPFIPLDANTKVYKRIIHS